MIGQSFLHSKAEVEFFFSRMCVHIHVNKYLKYTFCFPVLPAHTRGGPWRVLELLGLSDSSLYIFIGFFKLCLFYLKYLVQKGIFRCKKLFWICSHLKWHAFQRDIQPCCSSGLLSLFSWNVYDET